MKMLFAVFVTLLSFPVYANTGYGACSFGKGTVDSITCYGATDLKETIITGNVKAIGPFKAKNATMNDVAIVGTANLENATVKGSFEMTGLLHAENVQFGKGVNIVSSNVVLSHSTVAGSVAISSNEKEPYLKVDCGSKITGSVEFHGPVGVVQLAENAAIEGKIVNGKTEILKKKCGG